MQAPYRESADPSHIGSERVPLRVYRWAATPKLMWAALPFLAIVFLQVWVIISPGEVARAESSFSTIMVLGLMGVSIAYIAHRAFGARTDGVRVFDDGIVLSRDGRVTEIAWDDAATLTSETWVDERGRRGERHVLSSARGAAMTFTHELEQVDDLVVDLGRRLVRRLLPQKILALRAGQVVEFGQSVAVSNDALVVGRERLAWADVARAEAASGALVVRLRGGETKKVDQVPNAPVAAQLVEHARPKR